jgi:hypothetical protein
MAAKMTVIRKSEIAEALLCYLIKKHTPTQLFPENFNLIARKMRVPVEDLREFLHPLIKKYFDDEGVDLS